MVQDIEQQTIAANSLNSDLCALQANCSQRFLKADVSQLDAVTSKLREVCDGCLSTIAQAFWTVFVAKLDFSISAVLASGTSPVGAAGDDQRIFSHPLIRVATSDMTFSGVEFAQLKELVLQLYEGDSMSELAARGSLRKKLLDQLRVFSAAAVRNKCTDISTETYDMIGLITDCPKVESGTLPENPEDDAPTPPEQISWYGDMQRDVTFFVS